MNITEERRPKATTRYTLGRMTMKSTCRVLGHSLAPLAHSLAPHCSLRSRARSLAHSVAHGKAINVYGMNASISYNLKPLCNARWVE